ncbi:MAG: SUMF1/EgtB/PvdO family nonheme iron enzyme [Myxococcales bacterium]|nr:SUMF1/EgtB/PvdO family nonheme iron enzyme [Myxococcales bacterium]
MDQDLRALALTLLGSASLPATLRAGLRAWLAGDGAVATEVATEGGTPEPTHPSEPHREPRYVDLGPLARGGMGELRRVRDPALHRVLALKTLPEERAADPGAVARFLSEARLTASLQHPGVVPVHDCGVDERGRPWFAMTEVRGRTLRAVLRELHEGPEAPSPSALRRALDTFARACEAVAYAHSLDVVHRDLKPDNIMVGALGEVLVVDWGLALRATDAPGEDELRAGTPAYMPPEQARGDARPTAACDVYALGAVLYELLGGAPPYTGTPAAVRAQLLHGPPPPVAAPADLLALCERAMARDPAGRPSNASELLRELRLVLDGAQRRERALRLVDEARALHDRATARRALAQSKRDNARAAARGLRSFDAAERKEPSWALQDEANRLDAEGAALDAEAQQTLAAALREEPTLNEAHEALARVHAEALVAAERAGDDSSAARAEAALRSHDRGAHTSLLRGMAALSLRTEPVDAEVRLYRYEERRRRLVAEPCGLLGRTPLRARALPRGSYLLELRGEGRSLVRYPVHLARGEHWDGVPDGEREARAVYLPAKHELGAHDRYVPAGPCWLGGDPRAGETLPAARVWIEGFVLRRFPVTQREYLAFLNALVAAGREDEAASCAPRLPASIAGSHDVALFRRTKSGRFALPEGSTRDAGRLPVSSIDWFAAARAAQHFATRERGWRLPSEREREKAARGVDGRSLPWGEQLEPTWACMVGSRSGAPALEPIDAFATDESVYGVRGLAGNMRDWCLDRWTPDGDGTDAHDGPLLRSIRGGTWSAAPHFCRPAARYAAAPDNRFASVGMRLARDLPPR